MLENNTFAPRDPPTNCAADFVAAGTCHVIVSGGGPIGLVLDESRRALYALTRFDNSISIIDTTVRAEINHVAMFNPEPPSITVGRPFLYDANATSSNGETSCASCHVFGDFDSLAWDLGNPDGTIQNNPGPFRASSTQPFHPLKGPMTTQSLRGMDNHGPMHWRADRTAGTDAPSVQPASGSFDTQGNFMKFIVAFESLLGRSAPIATADMQAFANFAVQIMYPPNPLKNLDNVLTPDQFAGQDFFFSLTNGGLVSDGVLTCNGCHVVDPAGNAQFGVPRPGFFGTDGFSSGAGESQLFKIPHLRNQYQKVGMFGSTADPLFLDPTPFMGDQVRGFGFLHDGSIDTVFRFMGHAAFPFDPTFNPGGIPPGPDGVTIRRQAEAFQLAFYTNFPPMFGQQLTLTSTNRASVGPRLDLMEQRGAAGDCDLIAKGLVQGQPAGFLYNGDGTWSRSGAPDLISDVALRALAQQAGAELTFTCVRAGWGGPTADEL
jgi:cytochrome c peroxidase